MLCVASKVGILATGPGAAAPRQQGLQARRAVVLRAKQHPSGGEHGTAQKNTAGITFQPFQEVAPVQRQMDQQGEMNAPEPQHSFARVHTYSQDVEAAMNEQINVEYTISYVYHSMASYFDRDNVSLPSLAHYFREESVGERGHAQRLIDLQNTRGGRVRLRAITDVDSEFDHPEKGDALYAMELSLSLEKLNFDKLMALWKVAEVQGDPQLTQYIEDMLHEQVQDIKQVADYVAQLRRVGKGQGVWLWDRYLAAGDVDARTV